MSLQISKDDMLGMRDPIPAPGVLQRQRALMRSFVEGAHAVVTLVLDLLNEHLGLPHDTLASMHRLDQASGDHIRLIRAPAQPPDDRRTALGAHTDFGSVTVLFNRLGGLQILPPGSEADWVYVKPLPGHAVVNLGDAMAKFTQGLLRSNIHRVSAAPGLQADVDRYSLVYFNRPRDDVVLRRLDGSSKIPPIPAGEPQEDAMTSADWVSRRSLGRRHKVHGAAAYDVDQYRGTEEMSMRLHASS